MAWKKFWFRDVDSNHDTQLQRLMSYRLDDPGTGPNSVADACKCAQADGKNVVVYWENADEQNFFDIDDIWMPNGTPNRIGNKKAFKFESKGHPNWVFINVSQD